MSRQRPPIEQVLDLVVYAPIGLATQVQRSLPALVGDGRRVAEQRIQLARFIGKMAVTIGRQELERRLAAASAARTSAPTVVDATATDAAGDTPPASRTSASDVSDATEVAEVPDANDLPIVGYDSLAASQVALRLSSLTADELAAVEAYEAHHRARRSVLAKISQLRDA